MDSMDLVDRAWVGAPHPIRTEGQRLLRLADRALRRHERSQPSRVGGPAPGNGSDQVSRKTADRDRAVFGYLIDRQWVQRLGLEQAALSPHHIHNDGP